MKQRILVCHGTGCTSSASPQVRAALDQEIGKAGLSGQVQTALTGCHGFCQNGPLTVVEPDGVLYARVRPEDAEAIVQNHLLNGRPVERLLYKDPIKGKPVPHYADITFYKGQRRVVLRRCGHIDPEDIEEYLADGGYQALGKVLKEMSPEEVIAEVKRSGLRGRGGAGFPTGLKWEFCRKAPGNQKYMVCNGDEGDPGAFMDRSILEGDPHSVIEGMVIAAYAIGASEGYAYIRAEYPLAVQRVRHAVGQAIGRGFLGDDILGSEFSFHLHIKEGAGAFVCGEETALIASIEGRRGMPRPRPPFPAQSGLWGRPTTINNVETLANIPAIISRGADWYASMGTEKSRGTKVFSLTGKVRSTGLVEVPMGTTLHDVVFGIGGGISGGRAFKAAQTGGPSGGCLPAAMLDLPIDYDSLTQAGSIMGSGGLVVMDETTCMVDIARFFLSFTQAESCGKCAPCRLGTKQMHDLLESITQGKGMEQDLVLLSELAQTVKEGSLCGLGQTAPNPVLSTLRHFRHEYEAHIREKRCPAAVCRSLVDSPCQHTCPAGIDVPRHLRVLMQGKYAESLAIIRERNPFPGVTGYVCPHPCETKCRRGQLDQPVSIRGIRRFISDHVEVDPDWREPLPEVKREERVAVVGAGPAGLSAAYFLAKMGYGVTVFEALPVAGGMMAVGIPYFRLPKEVLAREIRAIERLGVEIRLNTPIGPNLTLQDLRQRDYKAIFVAIGAHRSQPIGVPGEDKEGIISAVDLLREVNLGRLTRLEGCVAVVGGGSVATDAARTAWRLGAREVSIVYRRIREDMPAEPEELTGAEEEHVRFEYLAAPKRILGNHRVAGLECLRTRLGERDSRGRRRPVVVEGSEFVVPADVIVSAIGQTIDSTLTGEGGLAATARGTLAADPFTYATNLPGVFAGGDAVYGPATVIEAIAAGEKAAISIDRYLRGEKAGLVNLHEKPLWKAGQSWPVSEEGGQLPRQQMPMLPVENRAGNFDNVELGYDRATALREATRCLHCDLEES